MTPAGARRHRCRPAPTGRGPRVAGALAAGALVLAACGATSTRPPPAPTGTVDRFGVVGTAGKVAASELARPTPVAGIVGRVTEVATSNSDGYALTASGAVYAWGVGSAGELGDGTTPAFRPSAGRVQFPAGVRIVRLANPMPFDAALAVDSRGDVWGWGLSASGDLCLAGGVIERPERLPLSRVSLAAGARLHSLFDAEGHVVACGSGVHGALGDGSTATSTTPVAVVGLPAGPVAALTASWDGSGVLLADGRYEDWGYNAGGQLGDGGDTDQDTPVPVALPVRVRQVFQGGSGATNGQTVAIGTDGSVWAWGDGSRGQLGRGSRAGSDRPVRVAVPTGVRFASVSSGGYTSYAIDRSGRLWAWGGNQNGQLGTGAAGGRALRPVLLGGRYTQVTSTASNVAALSSAAR